MELRSPASHRAIDGPDDFQLTDAVRPAPVGGMVPREAWRIGHYRDDAHGLNVPVLAASVSREKLFDAFLALLGPLGEVVDVVLETSHDRGDGQHRDLYREAIDRPVLASILCDFEDLLLHDGCTGIAVIGKGRPVEMQFDEHKALLVYAARLAPFQRMLRDLGVERDDSMRLLMEGDHLHDSQPRHRDGFEELAGRLGLRSFTERDRVRRLGPDE